MKEILTLAHLLLFGVPHSSDSTAQSASSNDYETNARLLMAAALLILGLIAVLS